MAKKSWYRCEECGYKSAGYMGKCPNCGAWGTLHMEEEVKTSSGKSKSKQTRTTRLREIEDRKESRIKTSLEEFNRVMGGGILPDGVSIVTAQPGAGKSTLLFQVANDLASQGMDVLYASGEESEHQIKERANRITHEISENLWIYAGNSMDQVLSQVEEIDPAVIILDSIQTFTLEEHTSRAGSPTQTMACATALVDVAKNQSRPRMVFIVGQMTKEDQLAGVRALEHLVDTVLMIDNESNEELRVLLARKNRFGSTGEMGFFYMDERGMISIDNPSRYFMTTRMEGEEVPGSALSIVREGTRPVVLEVEALVSQSFTPYPQRIGECMRREQLNTLISVLEERANIRLYDKNVVVKTTGGLRLRESAANLAVLMSIASSVYHRPLDNNSIFIGDVGLTGELKAVPAMEMRLKEAERMGYQKIYTPKLSPHLIQKFKKLETVQCRTLSEVINRALGK